MIDKVQHPGDPERPAQLEIREGNRVVRPRSDGQARYMKALLENELVFCIGPAGTGKTYLAVATAVCVLATGADQENRAGAAGGRGRRAPGVLARRPGGQDQPLSPSVARPALHDLMDYDQIRRYMDNDLIEIAPLAYMRGRTLNDAAIILDEGQNATVPQMKMFLTRMGQNRTDRGDGRRHAGRPPAATRSGLADAIERLKEFPGSGRRFSTDRTSSGTRWCRRSSMLMKPRNRHRNGTTGLSPPRPSPVVRP